MYLSLIQAFCMYTFESGGFWCGLYVVKSAVNHGRRCGYKWFELCTAVRKLRMRKETELKLADLAALFFLITATLLLL